MARNKSKSVKKSRASRHNKTRRNVKKTRKYVRKVKGGAMSLPLRSVIPFNNYDAGDPQREMENARNL